MKRSDLLFALVLIPLDAFMIIAAGLAAYFLRFQAFTALRPVIFEIPFQRYLGWVFLVALVYLCIFAFSGLYTIGYRRIRNELQRIVTACSTSIMLVIVFIFFIKELFTSRFIVLAAWLLSIAFVIIGRLLLRQVRAQLFRHSVGLHPIAVIGPRTRAQSFIDAMAANRSWGYVVACHIESFSSDEQRKLEDCIREKEISEIAILDPSATRELLEEIITFATVHHISVRYAADIISAKQFSIGVLAGTPFILIKRTKLEGWGRIWKRASDIVLATFFIILAFPLFIIIAIAIAYDSPGPVIYRNIRVGPHGLFPAYKFRRMKIELCTGPGYDTTGEAEKLQEHLVATQSQRRGPVFKVLNDPRMTRVGRFLERTSLDELPQLFNVLRGTMSLVGPRPHMPQEVAGYAHHHHQLFSVKPGITGLAQISGRSDLDFDDEAKFDMIYVENWSPILDLIILCKTPFAVLMRKSNV